jgi:hypothetical protein
MRTKICYLPSIPNNAYKILAKNLNEREHMRQPEIDGRIILK